MLLFICRVLRVLKLWQFVPDNWAMQILFRISMKKKLNLKNPQTFNEKLQWLKLHDRKPEYTAMVDKYEAKKYVAERIGEEYIIPTLGVWDKFDDIDFDALPNQFVLKCTHDSGGLVICRDKGALDKEKARAKINRSLKRNYYFQSREWPYKDVKPRIIAEKYLGDEDNEQKTAITDYKFFCFEGIPKLMYVSKDKSEEPVTDFYDMSGTRLDMRMRDPNSINGYPLPQNFEKMQELAGILSDGLHHLRVDFYECNGKIYMGELTFFHCGGFARIYPNSWEKILGDWIILSDNT